MKIALSLILASLLFSACKTQTPQSTAPQNEKQAMNEFAELSSAIEAGRPVSCVFTKSPENTVMTYMMKGKKIKISGMQVEGQAYQGAMMSDGEYMHTWDEVKKEGVKMKLPAEQDLKDFAKEKGQSVPDLSDETERKTWEDQGYRIDCKEATIADSEFIPPTDIKFTDMSAMMESVNTMMKSGDDGSAPNAADQKEMQEQINKMMQQYGQQ